MTFPEFRITFSLMVWWNNRRALNGMRGTFEDTNLKYILKYDSESMLQKLFTKKRVQE